MSPPQLLFNEDFYSDRRKNEFNKKLGTKWTSCFNCHRPDAKKICTGCNVSRYCNRNCQILDWKRIGSSCTCNDPSCMVPTTSHKILCKRIHHYKSDGLSKPLPILLDRFYPSMISPQETEAEMMISGNLFIDELVRISVSKIDLAVICVNDRVDHPIVRLIGCANLVRFLHGVGAVERVFFHEIDRGDESVRRLAIADCKDCKSDICEFDLISAKAKKKVVPHIVDFVKRLNAKGVKVNSLRCGFGVKWLAKNEDFLINLKAANSGVSSYCIADSVWGLP